MIRSAGLLLTWVLALAPGPGFAADSTAAPPPAENALAQELGSLPGEALALDEALRLSLDGAIGLKTAEADLRASRGALRREKGSYDPVLFADWLRSDEDTPTASPFAGADVLETETQSVAAGARLRLPIGTELAAVVQTTRLETNSSFAVLNPEHATSGRLELRQPLLRGFGPAANAGVAAAARELDAARARASDAARAVAADVESAYWNLHAAERELAVRRLLVEAGRNLVEQASRRVEVGLSGPSELATARFFLADQELAALEADERLEAASDALASLVGRRPADSARFRTATPPPSAFDAPDEETLLARSLERNDELRAAEADLAAAEARARAAWWDRLPRLDVLGSVGGNGLSGTGQSVAFLDTTFTVDSSGGFSESFEQVTARDYPTWSVGVSLEIPIFLREGRGERERLVAEVERSRARVEEVRRDVQDRARARSRELTHGSRRLQLSRVGVDAALEQARIGRIEYQNGRRTAFELVRLGADVAAAEQRYSDALTRTAKAAAELKRLSPDDTDPEAP